VRVAKTFILGYSGEHFFFLALQVGGTQIRGHKGSQSVKLEYSRPFWLSFDAPTGPTRLPIHDVSWKETVVELSSELVVIRRSILSLIHARCYQRCP